jgi:hypothetical protein
MKTRSLEKKVQERTIFLLLCYLTEDHLIFDNNSQASLFDHSRHKCLLNKRGFQFFFMYYVQNKNNYQVASRFVGEGLLVRN